jgi:hypothetical protein
LSRRLETNLDLVTAQPIPARRIASIQSLSRKGFADGAAQPEEGTSPNRRVKPMHRRPRARRLFESAPHLRRARNTSVAGTLRRRGFDPRAPSRIDQFRPIASGRSRLNSGESGSLKSAACGTPPCRAYRPCWRRGRVAEGGGLLNRYRVVKPYRGFESLRLRQHH